MLNDEDIIPICKRYAKAFQRQAMYSITDPEEAYNDLFNEAYVVAKTCSSLDSVATNVKYHLISYLGMKPRGENVDKLIDNRKTNQAIYETTEPAEIAANKEFEELLNFAKDYLNYQQAFVLHQHYYRGKSLQEIAGMQSMKVTRARVWQIKEEALDVLRRNLHASKKTI
jgi:RNA polymerase sigma factor (sigma-70 family)